ncbi:hyalin-like [Diadema setosum]|uniref:hyalin-like n=1 Tax=Diadema setosum TaxID=31175 RepID=UPI003B3AEB5F
MRVATGKDARCRRMLLVSCRYGDGVVAKVGSMRYTTPPDVECANTTLTASWPNVFWGLVRTQDSPPSEGQYTYYDENPDNNGISYDPPTSLTGHRYSPGYTAVTLTARDTFGNEATCVFYVFNSLTELPVECPDLNDTVATDTGQDTFTFVQTFYANDVDRISGISYLYVGGGRYVTVSIDGQPPGSAVGLGVHTVTTVISDDVLNKTCTSYILVEDTTPPDVECANTTLTGRYVNIFWGLVRTQDSPPSEGQYTYYDENPDNNGISYDPPTSFTGHRYSPGYTAVTLTARDTFGNEATCVFYVFNSLTELPVECPDLNDTVATDTGQDTFTFVQTFYAGDVDRIRGISYLYVGGGRYVTMSIDGQPPGSAVGLGVHTVTTVISDDVLNKTCTSYIFVEDTTPPDVECANTTLTAPDVNIFRGLVPTQDSPPSEGQYTYYDENPDNNGISYDPPTSSTGHRYSPGHTAVTLTARDAFFNEATCVFYVFNSLTELPVECPDLNDTVATDTGQDTFTFVQTFHASDVDRISGISYLYVGSGRYVTMSIDGQPPGSDVGLGVHTVTTVISDDVLNKTCTSYILVEDTTPPDVECANTTLTAPYVNIFWGLAETQDSPPSEGEYTYYDINPATNGISYDPPNTITGHRYSPGYTLVTLTARDSFGNEATCDFYVFNSLTELPVECPDLNDTVATDTGQDTFTFVQTLYASDVDRIDGISYAYVGERYVTMSIDGQPPGSAVGLGIHTVTTVISDDVLNKTCTSYILVEDKESPNVTCPEDIFEFSTNVVSFAANFSDNVDFTGTIEYSPISPGSRFDLGVTEVTANVSDTAGNIGSCQFSVNISLSVLPVICPEDEVHEIDEGNATYTYPTMTATNLTRSPPSYQFYDEVTIHVSTNVTSDNVIPIGTHELILVINDTVLQKTCRSVIIVQDTTPPDVECANTTLTAPYVNILWGLARTQDSPPSEGEYTYYDINPATNGISYDPPNTITGHRYSPGYTLVTLTARDSFGNEATCDFYVFNSLTELPVECPDLNDTVATDTGQDTFTFVQTLYASDVDRIDGISYAYVGERYVTMSIDGQPPGSAVGLGIHTVTTVISDDVLNKTCTSYILVEDKEPPNVTCPEDIFEFSTNVVSFAANFSDNVDFTGTIEYSPISPGSRFDLGVTEVTANVSDTAGNIGSCQFSVNISLSVLPVICPEDEVHEIDEGNATYTYPNLTATNLTLSPPSYQFYDEVTIHVSTNVTSDNVIPIGTHELILVINDTVLQKTCRSVITVQDTSPPDVECANVTLNETTPNIFHGLPWTQDSPPPEGHYTYYDENRPEAGAVSYSLPSGFNGYRYSPGYTPVTLIARDTFGNEATCDFYVFNHLTELPVLCPDLNDTVGTNTGESVFTFVPTFHSGHVMTSVSHYEYVGGGPYVNMSIDGQPPYSDVGLGNHTVITVISDDVLNKTCTSYILVEDKEPPKITGPEDMVEFSTNVVSFAANFSDNVDATGTIEYSPISPGSRFDLGVTEVTAYASDTAGNIGSYQFSVNISISELPIECPDDQVKEVREGESTYTYPAMTSSDLIRNPSSYQFYDNVSIFVSTNVSSNAVIPVGIHTLIIDVNDTRLQKECRSLIHVQDGHSPDLDCPANVALALGNIVWFNMALANDSVDGIIEPSYSVQNGSRFPLGITNVTVNASDSAGNTATCYFLVDIQMTMLPVEPHSASATVFIVDGEYDTILSPVRLQGNLTKNEFEFYGPLSFTYYEANDENLPGPPYDLSADTQTLRVTVTDGVLNNSFEYEIKFAQANQINLEVSLIEINGTPAIYVVALNNSASEEYRTLKAHFERECNRIYGDLPGFCCCIVESFTEGSIVVNHVIRFDATSNITTAMVMDTLLDAISTDSELNENSGLYLSSRTAFEISYPCESNLCANGATCVPSGFEVNATYECRCTSDWTGNHCKERIAETPSVALFVGIPVAFVVVVAVVLIIHAGILQTKAKKHVSLYSQQSLHSSSFANGSSTEWNKLFVYKKSRQQIPVKNNFELQFGTQHKNSEGSLPYHQNHIDGSRNTSFYHGRFFHDKVPK